MQGPLGNLKNLLIWLKNLYFDEKTFIFGNLGMQEKDRENI